MKTFAIVVAASSVNRGIGAKGGIPWRLAEDVRRFRDLTMGGTVIMGRKTYESIPERYRPLPGRLNVVISSSTGFQPGLVMVGSFEEALEAATEPIFVIGGERVYRDAIARPECERIYLTSVDYAGGDIDTFFPPIVDTDFHLVDESDVKCDGALTYRFLEFVRTVARE